MVPTLLCRYVSLYSPPCLSRKAGLRQAQRTQRIIIFLLPLRGWQWKSTKQLALQKRQKVSILWIRYVSTRILLPEGLSRFAFRRLSEKQKKQKLCDLCGSAVNNIYKDPFRVSIKPPFLGVVIDFQAITPRGP